MKLVIQDMCRHLVRTEEAAKAKLFTRNQCRQANVERNCNW